MQCTSELFVLAPLTIGGQSIQFQCARTMFTHNIACAVIARHLLKKGHIPIEQTLSAALAHDVFQGALNETIASFKDFPPALYLEVLADYAQEVTRPGAAFQDPWMPAFLQDELVRVSRERNATAKSVKTIDPDLVEASQRLISAPEGAAPSKKPTRQRKPTRKERIQQKRMLQAVSSALASR